MKIFIPLDLVKKIKKKSCFILVQHFIPIKGFSHLHKDMSNQKPIIPSLRLVKEIDNADIFLIPYPINYYFKNNLQIYLIKYNKLCHKKNIPAFGIIDGDYALSYKKYNSITYFRMSGFKSYLDKNNKGFPATLSDRYKLYYKSNESKFRKKRKKPTVGFCGHATKSRIEYFKQASKYLFENIKRFFDKNQYKKYEVFFQSGYIRYKILKEIEKDKNLNDNFLYREKYRGGAITKEDLEITTLEYYDNIKNSDYVICIRGSGNFSIRLYETLMMGRVPVFINTNCLLPFEELINWRDHCIWIEWADISEISNTIKKFHQGISENKFKQLQMKNRELWLNKLSPKGVFKSLESLINFKNDNVL